MFIHENEFIHILVNTRCGHTSMYEYFGIEPYSRIPDIFNWISSKKRRILVLRNPIDRINSAYKNSLQFIGTGVDPDEAFVSHSTPYLKLIRGLEFELIDFAKIDEYIPMSNKTVVTYSNNTDFQYIPNKKYTEMDVREEYELYKTIMNTKLEISVSEWKALTP